MIQSYKDLIVWKKSIELVVEVYHLTDRYPKEEIFGLVSQMRRAVVSIPSNIAEGYGRRSAKEYAQFYSIAYGSALELETQLIVCKELKFISLEQLAKVQPLLEEVLKMLNSMLGKMRQNYTLEARR